MTSGRKTLHVSSALISSTASKFSWRLFRAGVADQTRKCVAVLLVYTTVVAGVPVRADEPFRGSARAGSPTVVSPSSFLGRQSKGIGSSDRQVPRKAAKSGLAVPVARSQTLPATGDIPAFPLRLGGRTASLGSTMTLSDISSSTIIAGVTGGTLPNFDGTTIAGEDFLPHPRGEYPKLLASASQTPRSQVRNASKATPMSQGVAASCLYALDASSQGAFSISGSTSISTSCTAVVESGASQAFQMSGTEILYLLNNAQVDVVGGWLLSGQTKLVNQSTGQHCCPNSRANC
jgi:hypothetical protein